MHTSFQTANKHHEKPQVINCACMGKSRMDEGNWHLSFFAPGSFFSGSSGAVATMLLRKSKLGSFRTKCFLHSICDSLQAMTLKLVARSY